MLPGDFTTSGHFIVIYGHNFLGFKVYDPNSIERSERTWSYDSPRAADSPALEPDGRELPRLRRLGRGR